MPAATGDAEALPSRGRGQALAGVTALHASGAPFDAAAPYNVAAEPFPGGDGQQPLPTPGAPAEGTAEGTAGAPADDPFGGSFNGPSDGREHPYPPYTAPLPTPAPAPAPGRLRTGPPGRCRRTAAPNRTRTTGPSSRT